MNLKKHLNLPVISIILTSALLAVVSGCHTAQPILQSVIVKDTVIVTETKYLIDTLEVMKDTVIYKDKVRVQLQYVDRKVVVEAACDPDTIRINTVKIVTKEQSLRKENQFAESTKALSVLLLILFLGFLIVWLVRLSK